MVQLQCDDRIKFEVKFNQPKPILISAVLTQIIVEMLPIAQFCFKSGILSSSCLSILGQRSYSYRVMSPVSLQRRSVYTSIFKWSVLFREKSLCMSTFFKVGEIKRFSSKKFFKLLFNHFKVSQSTVLFGTFSLERCPVLFL